MTIIFKLFIIYIYLYLYMKVNFMTFDDYTYNKSTYI